MIRSTWVICALCFIAASCGEEKLPPQPTPPPRASAQPEEIELLHGLGYVTREFVSGVHLGKSGVTRYDRAGAYDGLNLFNSLDQTRAALMTMDGEQVHGWASDETGETWRQFHDRLPSYVPPYLEGWAHTEVVSNGDLLVIGCHHMLLRLDWDSNVLWKLDLSAHHDLSIAANGDIYVLTAGIATTEIDGELHAFLDNRVVVVAPDGERKRTYSMFDAFSVDPWSREMTRRIARMKVAQDRALQAFRASRSKLGPEQQEYVELIQSAFRGETAEDEGLKILLFQNNPEDLFHANSIQVLPRENPGLWRAGDLLISILVFDTIAVIDHETGRVVWTWGRGELQQPHHATLLPDGNILIFDNGVERKYSRIVKVNPKTSEIVWRFQTDPPDAFYSETRGGVQELPNGNVLIAETNNGRAFEVTPTGEVVWEYYNEVQSEVDGRQQRGALYRFTRIDPSSIEPLKVQ